VAAAPKVQGEETKAAMAATAKHVKPMHVASAESAQKAAEKAPAPAKVRTAAAKPLHVAEARDTRKPARAKAAGRIEKDATPDSKEVLAGWKLRGTWPSHGPSQLAWIADENGRLATVSVGMRVAGARVLSIGSRGEVVQTTAGQILP
jgi:hypothetical protein